MARIPRHKALQNTRLGSSYGSWIYCDGCNKTIGYLCYVTYDSFQFNYKCKCGNCGSMDIIFENNMTKSADQPLVTIKNRLCCSLDESPLMTILAKNLDKYSYEVVCKTCNTKYKGSSE